MSQGQKRINPEQRPLTDVGSIDEAEKIEQSYCRHDVEVDFPSQFSFCDRVEVNNRIAISATNQHHQSFRSAHTVILVGG